MEGAHNRGMREPLIERFALAVSELLDNLSYRAGGWADRRSRKRERAAYDLKYGPWANIGEPVQMDLGSGYASFTSTPITVEKDAEYGVTIGEGGVMQMRVRRPV